MFKSLGVRAVSDLLWLFSRGGLVIVAEDARGSEVPTGTELGYDWRRLNLFRLENARRGEVLACADLWCDGTRSWGRFGRVVISLITYKQLFIVTRWRLRRSRGTRTVYGLAAIFAGREELE
jgi:hypothetical protein